MKALRDTKLVALITLLLAMVVAGLASVAAGPSTRESPAFKDTFAANTPALAVTAWYFDNANVTGCAADTNSCTSATCGVSGVGPCATFNQIVTRLGGTQPVYPPSVVVTFNQLSSNATTTDPIFFQPYVSNGGQANLKIALVNGVTFTASTVTAMTRGAPGNLLTVVFPGGTVPLKNQLVVNNTRSSQAIIDSVSGQTATMQSPITTASLTNTAVVPAPVEDLTWATTDSMTVYTLLATNVKTWRPRGQDLNSSSQPSGAYIMYASVNDNSNSNVGIIEIGNTAAVTAYINCVINARPGLTNQGGRGSGFGMYLLGVSSVGQVTVYDSAEVFGGGFAGGASLLAQSGNLDGDAIIHGGMAVANATPFIMRNWYCDNGVNAYGNLQQSGFAWGSFSMNVEPGNTFWNNTGSTFALKALLTSGTVKINTVATGYAFTAATGLWGTGTALTPSAIDSAPGASLYGQGGNGAFVTNAL
jgi:hypothetical protein